MFRWYKSQKNKTSDLGYIKQISMKGDVQIKFNENANIPKNVNITQIKNNELFLYVMRDEDIVQDAIK